MTRNKIMVKNMSVISLQLALYSELERDLKDQGKVMRLVGIEGIFTKWLKRD